MNIRIRLQDPILPQGAIIDADIAREADLDLLNKVIVKVYEEAEMARVPVPGVRLLEARLQKILKAVTDGLPPEVKLDIANKANG